MIRAHIERRQPHERLPYRVLGEVSPDRPIERPKLAYCLALKSRKRPHYQALLEVTEPYRRAQVVTAQNTTPTMSVGAKNATRIASVASSP